MGKQLDKEYQPWERKQQQLRASASAREGRGRGRGRGGHRRVPAPGHAARPLGTTQETTCRYQIIFNKHTYLPFIDIIQPKHVHCWTEASPEDLQARTPGPALLSPSCFPQPALPQVVGPCCDRPALSLRPPVGARHSTGSLPQRSSILRVMCPRLLPLKLCNSLSYVDLFFSDSISQGILSIYLCCLYNIIMYFNLNSIKNQLIQNQDKRA